MTITERLKGRPVYQGFPVPYTVVVDIHGVPDFKATDMDRWRDCVERNLCAICGHKLDYWVWYIGGPSCADEGIYFDLAMHEECCFFSAAVCPFIAKGRDYASHVKLPAGYERLSAHQVKRGAAIYASKRRRGVKLVQVGGGVGVKAGAEVERVL